MANHIEIVNMEMKSTTDLCKLAESLGYKSLSDFFDHNPDAMNAVKNYVIDNHLLDDDFDDDVEDTIIDYNPLFCEKG